MNRLATYLLVALALSIGGSRHLTAQQLSADSFLDHVSAHPVGDNAERDQYAKIADTLTGATPEEIARILPSVLRYTRSGNEIHLRVYAAGLLLYIALRPDGAALLHSKSQDISSLIGDTEPVIQRGAVAVAQFLLGRPETNNQPYLSAFMAAIENSQTPQEAAADMVVLLLAIDSSQETAVKSALDFLHRDDLTASTREALLHGVATLPGLPKEVAQSLSKNLDDPDPRVRAAVVVAFAYSTSTFHDLVKDRVDRMASDPQEHPQVRELAKKALAGETPLNPNIDVTLGTPQVP